MASKEVENYAIYVLSSKQLSGSSAHVAVIYLYGEPETRYRGFIAFHPDGVTLPDASYDSVNEIFKLRFNLCQFHSTMEMLRTEKPVYVQYKSPTNAFLRSKKEPTGEEETP